MKAKVTNILVKRGFNKDDAAKMVESNFDCAMRMFPEAKPAKIAEVVSCL